MPEVDNVVQFWHKLGSFEIDKSCYFKNIDDQF